MRLLIVGTLHGQLTLATKLAMEKGATVTHADGAEMALRVLRSGRGADLLMVEVAVDIRDLITRLEAEHITVPVVACNVSVGLVPCASSTQAKSFCSVTVRPSVPS